MSGREGSMRRHPSYRTRVSGLVSEARWQQAQDLANRLLVHAEEYSGGPVVPESPEVRWQRETDEVLAVVNRHADEVEEVPRERSQVGPVLGLIGAFTVVAWLPAVLSDLFGGWAL